MNKQSLITILLTVLMSMSGAKAFAYAFFLENSDGVTIYYEWANEERTEVAVSTNDYYSGNYTGNVNIPKTVFYNGTNYNVTSIGYNAFAHCTGLTSITIPNSVTKIENQAFAYCSNLSSIDIPNSVTSIGGGAFSECSTLSSINFPNSITYIGGGAFEGTTWYNNQPDGLIYIGKIAYKYKGNMPSNTKITIKDGTTLISNGAFYDCHNLISVSIPNSVESIGNQAFQNCYGLSTVEMPLNLTTIGFQAFYNCTSLRSIVIPNSVTIIGEQAFEYCSNMITITSKINKPFKVSNLNSSYSNYISLIVPAGTKAAYQSTAGWSNFNIVEEGEGGIVGKKYEVDDICYIIGDNNTVTVSSNNGKYIGTIIIPSQVNINSKSYSVTSIGSYAFDSCVDLLSVTIPNSVTTINSYAFSGCGYLSSLTIGSGVTQISGYIYAQKVIWLTNTPPSGYASVYGSIHYVSNDQFQFGSVIKYPFLSSMFEVDGIRYVPVSLSERTCDAIDCVYDESASITKLAPTVTYKGVTLKVQKIQPYICYNNKFINHLTMEVSGEINVCSFYGCSNMQTAILGKTNNDIDKDKFTGIYIGSDITKIGNWVFYGCGALNKLHIADRESELTLGSSDNSPIFSSCPLESVYIGGNITYSTDGNSGYSPFYRNTAIRSVTITDKETEISQNEFYGCTNLQRVSIGDGVTDIGDWAFSGCQSLSYFAFGSKLQNIGKEAFSDCTKVGEIISKSNTAPVCGSQALDDINKWDCKLYVPVGTISSYQNADQWKEFLFAEEGSGTAEQNPGGEGPLKCETPKITYAGDKVSFSCDTEGVKYIYRITGSDMKAGNGSEVGLQKKYTISVYATKDGYVDSDVAKSTIEIGGSGVFGDIDGDGKVNVADHVKLSDIIMNK